jgi:hypothetical protein
MYNDGEKKAAVHQNIDSVLTNASNIGHNTSRGETFLDWISGCE